MLVITAGCVLGSLLAWVPAAGINIAVSGLPSVSPSSWLGVLYLAVGGTTLAYVGWIAALRHVDAASAAPTLFLQPLVGTVLAVLFLGERLTWATVIGGALIIAGIAIVSRVGRQAEEIVGAAEVLA
jgi:drug/metabolite transporter (DMT)-like permease